MQKVSFFFHDKYYSLRHKTELKRGIERLFKKEGANLAKLDYIFCSDDYLIKINRNFLKHDEYTDIITFDMSESKKKIAGEIYISIDRVTENARSLSVSVKKELCRVVFHGALHLCGYKDKEKSETKVMRDKEDEYLNYYFKRLSR